MPRLTLESRIALAYSAPSTSRDSTQRASLGARLLPLHPPDLQLHAGTRSDQRLQQRLLFRRPGADERDIAAIALLIAGVATELAMHFRVERVRQERGLGDTELGFEVGDAEGLGGENPVVMRHGARDRGPMREEAHVRPPQHRQRAGALGRLDRLAARPAYPCRRTADAAASPSALRISASLKSRTMNGRSSLRAPRSTRLRHSRP